jgi:hypothetical protein
MRFDDERITICRWPQGKHSYLCSSKHRIFVPDKHDSYDEARKVALAASVGQVEGAFIVSAMPCVWFHIVGLACVFRCNGKGNRRRRQGRPTPGSVREAAS